MDFDAKLFYRKLLDFGSGVGMKEGQRRYEEEMRKEVGHLFLFMKGAWQYSDNGIDWEPADEALPMPREVA